MSLVRWTPRTELETWTRDPFFRRFFDVVNDEVFANDSTWHPALDLVEEKDRLVVSIEAPGIDPKNVQIELQEEMLTVQGERKLERDENDGKFLKRELRYGPFTRTLQLPYRVQSETVKAQYKNGVLTISLPKAEEHVGRQIPVEAVK